MEVHAMVQIGARPYPDVLGSADADVILNGRKTLCMKDDFVRHRAHTDADDPRDPCEPGLESFADRVTP
jgi:hypothetical protein